MVYILLLISFVILIKGADIFVKGSSYIAKMFQIPELIIGIVIVGFGTSLPEFAVNMAAIANNSNEMAVGNIVGSNVFNILFIVGVIAIFRPMIIDHKLATFDFPMTIAAAILLPFLALDGTLLTFDKNLNRVDGLILILIFIYFVKETIKRSLMDQNQEKNIRIPREHMFKNILMIIIGLAAVIIGGDMVVKYASKIAIAFGMSNHLVGLTIVGIGTSLPELAVSIIAARKGQQAIVIGNIIGSNTFNILFTLGATMLIKPIVVNHAMIVDSINVGMVTILVGIIAILNKKIGKLTGIIFVFIYVWYMYSVLK